MAVERIDKIISNSTKLSRNDVRKAVKCGRVGVNGAVIKDSAVKADCDCDVITLDGEKLVLRRFVYIMMNKPKGVVSASEGRGDTTVVDILPDEMKRGGLFPAGRLDKDTTGFVLITDDGEFAHKILSPKNHIDKTYIVGISSALSESDIKTLSCGLELRDGTTFKPAKLRVIDDENVEITIHEGKYHQIKRMFKAVGNEVVELRRIKMGSLFLDEKLLPGECRYINEEELKQML